MALDIHLSVGHRHSHIHHHPLVFHDKLVVLGIGCSGSGMTSSSTGSRMVVAACSYSLACWSSSSWKVSPFTCCFTSSISAGVSRVLSSICFF